MAERPPSGIPDRRKRHEPRHLAFGVRANVGPIDAKVTNVSRGGLGVEVPEALRVGKTMSLTVRAEQSSVDVTGVVRWCRMEIKKENDGETKTVYGVGLKFEGVPVERIQRLEEVTKLPLTEETRKEEPEGSPAAGFDMKQS